VEQWEEEKEVETQKKNLTQNSEGMKNTDTQVETPTKQR
jgi:hypothetical protein